MDAAMNWLFRVLTTCSFGVIVLIIYKHIAQKSKASHYAALITQNIEHGRGEAVVQADNSIAVYIDNQLITVITDEIPSAKTNDFTVSSQNVFRLIKDCIRYLVEQQNMKQSLKDFWFYNNKIKAPLKKEKLYEDVINKWRLKGEPYGVFYKQNKAGQ